MLFELLLNFAGRMLRGVRDHVSMIDTRSIRTAWVAQGVAGASVKRDDRG